MTQYNRVFNFSAGPSMLPVEVLENVQRELLNYQGSGQSVMEMSHRSQEFKKIIDDAEADLRVPAGWRHAAVRDGSAQPFDRIQKSRLRADWHLGKESL